MKKTVLIVALAFVMVLALGVSPAFAKYAGFDAATQYVDWTVAASMASQNADSALQTFGPHKGYATTTIKCAVCHSVHRGGSKLLNSGAACTYCHTSAAYGGGAVANTISWSNGLLNTGTGTATSGGPHSSCASSYCHGGPHGVGASTYAGPATRLIVAAADTKILADATANGLTAGSLGTWSANTRVLATGGVCSRSGCHVDSAMGVITAGAAVGADMGGNADVADAALTGHRVIAAATTNWNANGNDFPTTVTNKTIAYKPVDYCNSCHDLTDDNNGNEPAFPHGNNDVVSTLQGKVSGQRAAVWLTAAADSGAQGKAVGSYNDYNNGADTTGPEVYKQAGSTVLDGICLKCHKSPTSGIGVDY